MHSPLLFNPLSWILVLMLYRVIIRKYDTCHNQLHEDSYFWGKCNHTRCKHFYWKFQSSLSLDRVAAHSVYHLVHVASEVGVLIMSVCQTSCESKIIITSLVPRLYIKHFSHGDWLSVLCRPHQTELTIISSNLSNQTISGQIVCVSGQSQNAHIYYYVHQECITSSLL